MGAKGSGSPVIAPISVGVFTPGHEIVYWENGEPVRSYLNGREITYRTPKDEV